MTSFVPGVLLALGTITAIPVPPPSRVDRGVARVAVLAMPFAVLPVTLALCDTATVPNITGILGNERKKPLPIMALCRLSVLT